MAQFGVAYPLWSFAGEQDERLARLIGEVGIDHITVPVITGPVTQFRLEPETGPHYFHTEGGWHYQPERDHYAGTELKPRVAQWTRGKDVLSRLCEHAARQNVRVLFEVDLRGALTSMQAPHFLQRNVWNEPKEQAGPCVLQPDCQQLLGSVLQDLLRLAPSGLELHYWFPDMPEPTAFSTLLRIDPELHALVHHCYCSACAQAGEQAGIDVRSLRRSAQVEFARLLQRGPTGLNTSPGFGDAVPNHHEYWMKRADAADAWYQQLAQSMGNLSCFSLDAVLPGDTYSSGPLRGWTQLEESSALLEEEELNELLERKGRDRESGSGASSRHFRCGLGGFAPGQEPTLVRFAHRLTSFGVEFFEFSNADCVSQLCVSALKQAVRFARRESES